MERHFNPYREREKEFMRSHELTEDEWAIIELRIEAVVELILQLVGHQSSMVEYSLWKAIDTDDLYVLEYTNLLAPFVGIESEVGSPGILSTCTGQKFGSAIAVMDNRLPAWLGAHGAPQ